MLEVGVVTDRSRSSSRRHSTLSCPPSDRTAPRTPPSARAPPAGRTGGHTAVTRRMSWPPGERLQL